MRTKRWLHSVLWAFLTGFASSILLSPATALADTEVLLSMPEPPDDFVVLKEPIEVDGKRLGQTIIIAKEGSPSRVVISVETGFDRSTQPARVAATKAYVNTMAATLKKAGMELVASKLPDLLRADFSTPLQTDMTFSNLEGTKLYTRQFVFFSKYGYNVQIASTDPQDVETLAKWAEHIKPAN